MKYLAAYMLFCCYMIAAAQRPIPCCAPTQFTIHYEQYGTTQTGDLPMLITKETLDAGYDFIKALVGMEVTVFPFNGKPETKLKIIQNFTSGFQWVIEGTTCTKQSLASIPPPQRCIPEDALFEGTFTVGLENLKVHKWLISTSAPGPIKGMQKYTVTDYMCTPLLSTVYGNDTTTQPPTEFLVSGNYMNFSNKITDPDRWFKLPSSCNTTGSALPLVDKMTKIAKLTNLRNAHPLRFL